MDTLNRILTGNCLDVLPQLPAASITLAFADPPFNIGLDYPGHDDRLPVADYLSGLEAAFAAVRRVLTPEGSLWVAIGQRHQAKVYCILEGLGLHWRNTIVWAYEFGPNQHRKFSPCWTAIHYFTMDPKRFTFNAAEIRVPSRRQTKYNDKRADPGGKVPDDVWRDFPRVCGTFRERKGHCCQMPAKLLELVVRTASNPGDVVLDPFAGTGTTLVAAQQLGRRFIGIEKCEATADLARQRLADCCCDLYVNQGYPASLPRGRVAAGGLTLDHPETVRTRQRASLQRGGG